MLLPVETRVYPVPVTKTPPTPANRPQRQLPGSQDDSAQRAAQAFVETLPPEIRERVGSQNKDQQRRNAFSKADHSAEEIRIEDQNRQTSDTNQQAFVAQLEPAQIYTAPILTPSATLLQAQLSPELSSNVNGTLSTSQHEGFHANYISAGAQPGGRSAALAAALAREEQAQQTLIVPPVLTSVNFVA